MSRAAARVTAIVFVVVLAVVPLTAALGGAAGGYGTTVAQQDTASNQPTLEDLRAGGERPANAPYSIRASGTYSEYALRYLPTGLLVDDAPDSRSWTYLRPDTVVRRDTVQLWSKRGYGLDSKDITVRVAHYQQRERTNGNETEQVATNVTTYSIDATVGGGYDRIDVDLRSHYKASYETVICVEEPGDANCLSNPGDVRWTLQHQTSPANKESGLDTQGDKVLWTLVASIVILLTSTVSLRLANRAIERAKSKPSIPFWVYPVGVIGTIVVVFGFWDQLVETFVRAPWAFAFPVGGFIGLVAAMWFGANKERALFFRLKPDEWFDAETGLSDPEASEDGDSAGVAADGGETGPARPGRATSGLVADAIPVSMVRGSDGERYHVARGFWSWLARARGAVSPLETVGKKDEKIRTRVDVDTGPYSELYFLDPKAPDEDVIEYQPERHDWEFPTPVWKDEQGWHVDTDALFAASFGILVASLGGYILLASAPLGLLIGAVVVGLWKFAEPKAGVLRAKLSDVHYRDAFPTVLENARNAAEAASIEQLFDNWQEAELEREIDQQELQDRANTSQMATVADRYVGNGSNGSESTASSSEPADQSEEDGEDEADA